MASRGDAIHVAVVPAEMGTSVDLIGGYAYTAFINCGVEKQPVEQVLNRCYSYRFLPVRCIGMFQKGVSFLDSMVGTRYNRLSLLSTLLPKKLTVPAFVSCENKDFMPRLV